MSIIFLEFCELKWKGVEYKNNLQNKKLDYSVLRVQRLTVHVNIPVWIHSKTGRKEERTLVHTVFLTFGSRFYHSALNITRSRRTGLPRSKLPYRFSTTSSVSFPVFNPLFSHQSVQIGASLDLESVPRPLVPKPVLSWVVRQDWCLYSVVLVLWTYNSVEGRGSPS